VDLQATDTITIGSPITVSAGGHGGNLTLDDATLLLNANLNTDGGSLTLSGTVRPGAGLVQLSAPLVTFEPQSRYAVQLNGTTAGTGFDQLQVTAPSTSAMPRSRSAVPAASARASRSSSSRALSRSPRPLPACPKGARSPA
jgi:hypothetical protein